MGYITEKDMTNIDNQILDHTRPSTGEPSPLPESSLKDAIRNADAAVEFVPIGAEISFDELANGLGGDYEPMSETCCCYEHTRKANLARFFRDHDRMHSEGDVDPSEMAEREAELQPTDEEWAGWRESRRREGDF